MTKDGIKKCIKELTVVYPNTYKAFSQDDLMGLIQTWDVQFKGCEDLQVWAALNKAISFCKFPPSIAEIKEHLITEERESDESVWEKLMKAGRNSLYGSEEEYQKLPESIRRVVTPGTLKEIALADYETLRFIRRDILNDYHSFKSSDREKKLLMTASNLMIEERNQK